MRIQAHVLSILEIFGNKNNFCIPNYQREYAWTEDECQTLLDDLISAFGNSEGEYFLGSVIVLNDETNNIFEVIDGQQRLTTLSLLIRALLARNERNATLKSILALQATETDEQDRIVYDGLRISNQVSEETDKILKTILSFNKDSGNVLDEDSKVKHLLWGNYAFLTQAIGKHFNADIDELKDFIKFLTESTKIIRITCDTIENALQIFETINNRGMSLTFVDIIKAQIYAKARNEGKEEQVNEQWKSMVRLCKENEISMEKEVFTSYMHILRAQSGRVNTSLDAILKFFQSDQVKALIDDMLANLNKVIHVLIMLRSDKFQSDYPKLANWVSLFQYFGNDYPNYLLNVALFNRVVFEDDQYTLKKDQVAFFEKFLFEVARLLFALVLDRKAITNVTKMFTIPITPKAFNLESEEDFFKALSDQQQKLKENSTHWNGQVYKKKLILMLLTTLNPKQDSYIDYKKMEIEHILPKSWDDNYYDTWNAERSDECMDNLGNLVLLERKLNLKGSNSFFSKKIDIGYRNSDSAEAQDLAQLSQWTYEIFTKRNDENVKTIKQFVFTNS